MQDTYRQAASLLLLRPAPTTTGYELLLLHKPRKRDAWQLPQGGVEEGETAEQCALRELHEEAGITDVTVLGKSDLVYQYNFPQSYRRFRPDHICGQHIQYVFATTPRETEVKVDGVEIDKYLWIQPSEIGQYLKRKEYLSLVQKLLKEAMEKVN
ncbi:MAG TPA: NUDIX hydrolase [Candidatus Peribacteraceae bacterium]|nr:NUDIX hydrolase [Candidatus Peribacteraceae bacterium]